MTWRGLDVRMRFQGVEAELLFVSNMFSKDGDGSMFFSPQLYNKFISSVCIFQQKHGVFYRYLLNDSQHYWGQCQERTLF